MIKLIGIIVALLVCLILIAIAIPIALAGLLIWLAIIPETLGLFCWFMSCEWLDFSVWGGFGIGLCIWIVLALIRYAVFKKI